MKPIILFILFLVAKVISETQSDAASYARYMVENGLDGVLSSQSADSPAFSFASKEDFAECYMKNGFPIFLLADISETSVNLKQYPIGSFTIGANNCTEYDYDGMPYDPLACIRFTFLGEFFQHPYPSNGTEPQFLAFQEKHPAAMDWIKFSGHEFYIWEFWFYQIHYVGGYGNLHYIGYIDPDVYYNATPVAPPFF